MPGFFMRLLISVVGLWLASAIVPGITFNNTNTMLLAAILLGVVNAIVRPIAIILTLPITVLTLGIFLLVINAAMLNLVASLLDGFTITGFGSALLGSVIISVVSWWASWSIGNSGRYEVIITRDRRF